MPDDYEILGAARGASPAEIKRAFRTVAKTCHPDTHPNDPQAEARFKTLTEAYAKLTGPQPSQAAQPAQTCRPASAAEDEERIRRFKAFLSTEYVAFLIGEFNRAKNVRGVSAKLARVLGKTGSYKGRILNNVLPAVLILPQATVLRARLFDLCPEAVAERLAPLHVNAINCWGNLNGNAAALTGFLDASPALAATIRADIAPDLMKRPELGSLRRKIEALLDQPPSAKGAKRPPRGCMPRLRAWFKTLGCDVGVF